MPDAAILMYRLARSRGDGVRFVTEETTSFQGGVQTIEDVARIAGVSASTVSRALAGVAGVREKTRSRIVAIADAHGFRPNQMASRLRTRRSGMIGVVVPLGHEKRQHLSDPFFMTMLGHLADHLTDAGYDMMLARVIPEAPDWLRRIVTSGMLDGLLLLGQSDQFDAIERTAADYEPMVAWGRTWPRQRHCSIGSDNVAGGRIAAAHLIERGARRLAFVGETRAPEIASRLAGVQQVASEAGIAAPFQFDVGFSAKTMARQVANHAEALTSKIDGVVAASDAIAIETIRMLSARGMDVPGTIRVTGYDDLPIAGQSTPRLSTVRQDLVRGAELMIDALFAKMAGVAFASVEMTPELIVREST